MSQLWMEQNEHSAGRKERLWYFAITAVHAKI